jgi:hypothetical protein
MTGCPESVLEQRPKYKRGTLLPNNDILRQARQELKLSYDYQSSDVTQQKRAQAPDLRWRGGYKCQSLCQERSGLAAKWEEVIETFPCGTSTMSHWSRPFTCGLILLGNHRQGGSSC